MSIFNRIDRANIVTSGPRSTSKACFIEKLSIAFLAPTSWLAALTPHSLRGLHVSIAYPAPILWQKRPCSQSHVKHVSVSTAMALKASDRRHHAIEFIRNPVSSYFHSQVFSFMRLSSLALPWIAIFARKCDCHAMVNSLAIARIAISTRNLRLSSLRLYAFRGIQILLEAILACHPARSTEWLDWVAKWCELWRIHTGPIGVLAANWCLCSFSIHLIG